MINKFRTTYKTHLGKVALSTILFLSFTACSYKLVGHGRALPAKFKTISIPIMENKTKEENLEMQISSFIRREFVIDGRLRVVKGDKADLVLKGVISAYSHTPVSFGTNTDDVTYKVTIAVTADIQDQLDDKYNIKQVFTATKDYKTTQFISGSDINKTKAIKEAGQTIGQSMVSIIIDNF